MLAVEGDRNIVNDSAQGRRSCRLCKRTNDQFAIWIRSVLRRFTDLVSEYLPSFYPSTESKKTFMANLGYTVIWRAELLARAQVTIRLLLLSQGVASDDAPNPVNSLNSCSIPVRWLGSHQRYILTMNTEPFSCPTGTGLEQKRSSDAGHKL